MISIREEQTQVLVSFVILCGQHTKDAEVFLLIGTKNKEILNAFSWDYTLLVSPFQSSDYLYLFLCWSSKTI